jgi:hypothetical protein
MIKKSFILIIFFLFLSIVYAEEDCTYDQKVQQGYYLGLCQKYKNCKYIESEKKVIIKRGAKTIEIMRGGCFDFGVSTTLTTSISTGYEKPEGVLKEALSLADEFWHDYVSGDDLRELLKKKKYQIQKTDTGYYYDFSHRIAIELMIEYSVIDGIHKITIGYYTNV